MSHASFQISYVMIILSEGFVEQPRERARERETERDRDRDRQTDRQVDR